MFESEFEIILRALSTSGNISFSRTIRAEKARVKAKMKAKMREIDQYLGGGKASPNVQGGLPTLGKRR